VIKVLFSLTAVSESNAQAILVLYALVPEGLKTKKIFGQTPNLITHSLVPVIAVLFQLSQE
jgi:hypothetical protein